MLSDGQSGLSYPQLAAPWQPTCPSALTTGGSAWTSGESAIAGQVDGGQTTWYGEACSGPLPAQYGYSGVASLESTATNLANTFQGTYYNALNHSATPGVSQPVTISGYAGWEVTFAINYTNAPSPGGVLGRRAGRGSGGRYRAGEYARRSSSRPFRPISAESNVAALVSALQLDGGTAATPPAAPARRLAQRQRLAAAAAGPNP